MLRTVALTVGVLLAATPLVPGSPPPAPVAEGTTIAPAVVDVAAKSKCG